MVQFRKMKASTFIREGFKSKKEAIAYLAKKGMTGHQFDTPTDVMVYLRQNPLPGEVEITDEVKDGEPTTPKKEEPTSKKEAPKAPKKAKKAPKTKKAPKAKKEEPKLEVLPEDLSGDESPEPFSDSEC